MKKLLSYLVPAILLIAIFGGMAMKLKKNKAIAAERVFHYQPESPAPSTGPDSMQNIPLEQGENLVFTGIFEPYRETKISPESPGKIVQFPVDAGSRVSKGQTLVKLDDALLKLQLQAVEVQMEGLTADVNRYRVLAEADAVQAVQLEKAQLGLKAAQVQWNTIQEQIGKTAIQAPFDGTVHSKLNEIGGFAAPGVPLLHLLDMSRLKFTLNVPEKDLAHFKIGQVYTIEADAFPDKKLTGTVSMIAPKANLGNSFPVQLTVSNNSNQSILAGMFGRIALSPIKK